MRPGGEHCRRERMKGNEQSTIVVNIPGGNARENINGACKLARRQAKQPEDRMQNGHPLARQRAFLLK